ncbi:hypothetical protein QO182_10370, partial [Flavobacterium sp. Arc2]
MKNNNHNSCDKNKKNTTKIVFFLLALMVSFSSYSQYYNQHYVAPAPWRYFTSVNELVVATESSSTVSVAVKKSDGTLITTLSTSKGMPAVYRFAGSPTASGSEYYAENIVISAAGLNITATAPVSVNLRNIASDQIDGDQSFIKGNSSLTSFGNAGIGVSFRVGYYRDGDVGNFRGWGYTRPLYSVMAINNNTSVKINGIPTITLNAGESYLFQANMGSLVETSGPAVVNTGAKIDTPEGCGDGTLDQVPPVAVLGKEYFIVRGQGNTTAEQTTVVATEANTKLTIANFAADGSLVSTNTKTLVAAGDFYTFKHGTTTPSNGNSFSSLDSYSASRIISDKNIGVYSGTAVTCEVDITSVAPVSTCGGSSYVETYKFTKYDNTDLPYFGYILIQSATDVVKVNGSALPGRRQLGTTGWYLINFTKEEIGSPKNIIIEGASKMTVSLVQQGYGFSMSAIFSNYTKQPDAPTVDNDGIGCTSTATLSTSLGFGPYQWFLDGNEISGAISNTYTTTTTGSYSVSSTLSCGASVQSQPISVNICSDVSITKTVNEPEPCLGSNVIFTITAKNNGPGNAVGVSVQDLLPSGYKYVSSEYTVGTYDNTSGAWTIGGLNNNQSVVLKITAKVNDTGEYINKATISSSADSNLTNNSANASTSPKSIAVVIASNQTECSDGTTTQTLTATATGGIITWYNSATAGTIVTSPTQVGVGSSTYYAEASNGNCSSLIRKAVTLTITPSIILSETHTNISCNGDSNASIDLNVTGGSGSYSYNWTKNGNSLSTSEDLTNLTVGTYSVTVTDTNNCQNTLSIVIDGSDTTPPVKPTLTDVTGECTATAVAPTTKDNCAGTITGTTTDPLTYNTQGIYTITWTFNDGNGNTTTATQKVTVKDVTAPVKPTLADVSGECTATAVAPTTTDSCAGTITGTTTDPLTYNTQGTYTITWTFNDGNGNTTTATQKVTVKDVTAPVKPT